MITGNSFLLEDWFFWRLQLQLHFKLLAKIIPRVATLPVKKPSDYNHISEFQEELVLQKLHLQLHFVICQEIKLQ